MPIYEYRCRKCGNVFEEWVKTFDSPELEPCPKCGGDAERIMSNTSFKLEGGGWFASCYGGKASGSASDAAPAADAAPAKADAAPRRRRRLPPVRVEVPRRLRPDFLRRGRLPAPFSLLFVREIP